MMDNKTFLENKPSSRRWFWFVTLYLASLLAFAIFVGILHILIPH